MSERPGRILYRTDGTPIVLSQAKGRRRRKVAPWRTRTDQLWIAVTSRWDLGQALVSAFLVGGTIFLTFGLGSWFFGLGADAAWTFWLIGIAMWIFSLAAFFSFFNDPSPRHGQRR